MAKDVKSSKDKKSLKVTSADLLEAGLEAQRAKAAAMAKKVKPTRTYVVQAGDNLSKIAKKVYEDEGRWQDIFEANKETVKNPNAVSVGQKLVIPE